MITDLLHLPLAKSRKTHKVKTVDELSYFELFLMGTVAIVIASVAAILLGVV